MTDGVARELEQAEARLAEARANLESACQSLPYGQWRRSRTFAEGFEAAAIEVGRLRALAEIEARRSRRLTWEEAERLESALAALAAREEVQS